MVHYEKDLKSAKLKLISQIEKVLLEHKANSGGFISNEVNSSVLVKNLQAVGAFSIGYSANLGGLDFTAVEQVEILERIAAVDASAAWRVMVGIDGGLFANYLDKKNVWKIIPGINCIFAGVLAPLGTGIPQKTPDGFEISGKWSMASGISSADMIFAGFRCTDGQSYVAILPASKVSINLDWDGTGLRASDSSSFSIDRVFVPRDAIFQWKEYTELESSLASPDLQMRKVPAVALGVCRAALDYVREIVKEKVSTKDGFIWKDSYPVQVTIGECEMLYVAAREAVYGTLSKRIHRLKSGKLFSDFTPDERIDTVVARAFAMRQAREIVRKLYDLTASASVYAASPMDQWLRDLETMNQHFLATNVALQSAGAHLVGGKPSSPLIVGDV